MNTPSTAFLKWDKLCAPSPRRWYMYVYQVLYKILSVIARKSSFLSFGYHAIFCPPPCILPSHLIPIKAWYHIKVTLHYPPQTSEAAFSLRLGRRTGLCGLLLLLLALELDVLRAACMDSLAALLSYASNHSTYLVHTREPRSSAVSSPPALSSRCSRR